MKRKERLQILLPVHNEALSVTRVVEEIYDEISNEVQTSFIFSEDGSRDDTPKILKKMVKRYVGSILISSKARKGYAKAVLDGFRRVTTDFVLCLDSDGQCDPRDFKGLWKKRTSAAVIIGWRKRRNDAFQRRLLSGGFKFFYKMLFGITIHDPSCPFIIIRKDVLKTLDPYLGILREGFWWEFIARSTYLGFTIKEVVVHHRNRIDGKTRVYTSSKLPGIAYTHIKGLFCIWRDSLLVKRV